MLTGWCWGRTPVHNSQGRILWARHRTALAGPASADASHEGQVGGNGAQAPPGKESMQRGQSTSAAGPASGKGVSDKGSGAGGKEKEAEAAVATAVQDAPDDTGAAEHTAMFTLWVRCWPAMASSRRAIQTLSPHPTWSLICFRHTSLTHTDWQRPVLDVPVHTAMARIPHHRQRAHRQRPPRRHTFWVAGVG